MSDAKNSTKLIIVTALVLIVCVGGALWFRAANTVPAISIPSHKLPSPNAFDYYVDAGNKLTRKDEIGFAIDDTPRAKPSGYNRVYSLAEKEAIVRDNAQALDRLREGFAYQCVNPPCRSDAGFPQLSTWRLMSKLLVLESQTKAGRGDWGGAANSCLDALYFGQEIPRGGVLIHCLSGIRVQEAGRREGWKTIDHLSASEARSAARRMEKIISRETTYVEILEEEKWCELATYLGWMKNLDWYARLACSTQSNSSWIPGSASASNALLKVEGLRTNKRKALRDYTGYMDKLIANARLPYASKPLPPPISNHPVLQFMYPSFGAMRFTHVNRCETQNALFAVSLALRAYRAEHGRYPNTLAELVPSYLSKLPDDPFALKGPLRYKKTGDKCVLYSIGPDGKDNGGKPVFKSAKYWRGPDPDHFVEPRSPGDIVAGVNK